MVGFRTNANLAGTSPAKWLTQAGVAVPLNWNPSPNRSWRGGGDQLATSAHSPLSSFTK
jgi:hypothetical protein